MTDHRVMVKVGVIRRHSLEIMLPQVEGIGVDQGILGRILSYGTITVSGTGATHEISSGSIIRLSSGAGFMS